MWSCAYEFRILLHFLRDRDHRIGEQVEFLLALRLGRFNHERATHNQRKADGIWMKSIIDQALRDVASARGGVPPFAHGNDSGMIKDFHKRDLLTPKKRKPF